MKAKTFWKSAGMVVCLGIGLLATRMLWAQEGRLAPQPLSVEGAILEKNDDARHTAWVTTVLKRIQTIKPGHTRADLMKVCTTEGGLSTGLHRLFVYQGCPYIKVDVKFRRADKARQTDILQELPTDIISEISRPYLEWSISD